VKAENAPWTAGVRDISGVRCLAIDEGVHVDSADVARDLIGESMAERAEMIVLPVAALDASFFQLRSGLAGEILQKMVNYRRKLAIVGDITAHVAASDAFRDLVRESDRGDDLVFVPDLATLEERLGEHRE